VTYYLAHRGGDDDFCGVPFPAAGGRVGFDLGRFLAARDRSSATPGERGVAGNAGLVVHEDPTEILRLPDRLWQVDDLEGEVRLAPRCLRCQSLTVRAELPTWLVLGPRGDAVARVIQQSRGLTDDQAGALAAMDATEEERLAGAVWARWLSRHASGSPVGCGLTEVHFAVRDAARRCGLEVFGRDPDDGTEVIVDTAWQQAARAANAAALAFGAPQIRSDRESRRLAFRWTSVVGTAHSGT
jgi:hypothetical protein